MREKIEDVLRDFRIGLFHFKLAFLLWTDIIQGHDFRKFFFIKLNGDFDGYDD